MELIEKIKISFLDDEYYKLIRSTLIDIEDNFKRIGVSSYDESNIIYEFELCGERIDHRIHSTYVDGEYKIRATTGIYGVINIISSVSSEIGCNKYNKKMEACITRLTEKFLSESALTKAHFKIMVEKEVKNCAMNSYHFFLDDKEEYCNKFLNDVYNDIKSYLISINYNDYRNDELSKRSKEHFVKTLEQVVADDLLSAEEIISLAKEAEIKAIHNK